MKKVLVFLTGIMLMFSFAANAQTLTGFEYFKGKWNVKADSPMGDVRMIIGFDTVDGKPAAKINDTEGKMLYEVVSTTITEKKALVKFIGSQGEVVMTLNVKEADTITGDIMDGTAWVTGERVK